MNFLPIGNKQTTMDTDPASLHNMIVKQVHSTTLHHDSQKDAMGHS